MGAAVLPALIALLCILVACYIVWLGPAASKEEEEEKEVHRPQMVRRPTPMTPPVAPEQPLSVKLVHAALKPFSSKPTTRPIPKQTPSQAPTKAPVLAVPSKSKPSVFPKSPWQRLQEADLREALQPPAPPLRVPLSPAPVPLDYTARLRKYRFQSATRSLEFSDPAFYRVTLPVVQRNVVSITLAKCVFPVSEYVVNAYNKWVDVEVGGNVVSVAMEEGDVFTSTQLAATLQSALVASGLLTFTVSAMLSQRKLVIHSGGPPFSLLFRTGPNVNESAWMLLGFPRDDTSAAASIVAPGIVDLTGTSAVDFFIDEVSNHLDSVDACVARIDLARYSGSVDTTYYSPSDTGQVQFFWPISRLIYLTFRFMVPQAVLLHDGSIVQRYRPYQFNGRQHVLELNIVAKEYKSVLEESVELEPNRT